jgi:hypothetical protein
MDSNLPLEKILHDGIVKYGDLLILDTGRDKMKAKLVGFYFLAKENYLFLTNGIGDHTGFCSPETYAIPFCEISGYKHIKP